MTKETGGFSSSNTVGYTCRGTVEKLNFNIPTRVFKHWPDEVSHIRLQRGGGRGGGRGEVKRMREIFK